MPSMNRKGGTENIRTIPPSHDLVGRDNWMSPLNKIVFFKAVKRGQQEVQISDGRQFSIDYDQRPGFVWISPIGMESVPAGWFDIKAMTHKEWLTR